MQNEKAAAMIEWFNGRTLPSSPFNLNDHLTIQDCRKYVDTNISSMISCESKISKGIGKTIFTNCYMRLFHLKQYIEQNEKSA